jgi:hypothetical protein
MRREESKANGKPRSFWELNKWVGNEWAHKRNGRGERKMAHLFYIPVIPNSTQPTAATTVKSNNQHQSHVNKFPFLFL